MTGSATNRSAMNGSATDLERDLDWFSRVLDARLQSYFKSNGTAATLDIAPPDLSASDSPYARFLREQQVPAPDRLVLLLALIPQIRPQLLDVLWTRNEATGRGFTEFGGAHAASHGGFLPTGETAVFLLAGSDLEARFGALRVLEADAWLARNDVVQLGPVGAGEPVLAGLLTLSADCLQLFSQGEVRRNRRAPDFPAQLIHTELGWGDLVLPEATLDQLEEIKHWILHGQALLHDWGMLKKLRPSFTSLFHGPPGTGKTLSACLLGKHCDRDVYRIDLSQVVSKYIGETEKNLARVFDRAEHRGWILFFDEADALFGKRTRVDDARDRFANQEISFLLQRIEDFDGVVILATNFKANIDEAFIRRFHSVVHFPMPKPAERLRIWAEAFSVKAELDTRIDFRRLSETFEVAGGTILNVVRYASLRALSRGGHRVLLEDIEEGIRRELLKEGRAPR